MGSFLSTKYVKKGTLFLKWIAIKKYNNKNFLLTIQTKKYYLIKKKGIHLLLTETLFKGKRHQRKCQAYNIASECLDFQFPSHEVCEPSITHLTY